ncbi:1512_t:CDS:2, partial [Funneliformis geosporum]
GFLEVREGKRENGETYTYKSANMRPLISFLLPPLQYFSKAVNNSFSWVRLRQL